MHSVGVLKPHSLGIFSLYFFFQLENPISNLWFESWLSCQAMDLTTLSFCVLISTMDLTCLLLCYGEKDKTV